MKNSIYVITTFEKLNIDTSNLDLGINDNASELELDFGYVRTVGWYKDLSIAEKVVESNACDINEGYYDWALIEEVPEGLYPFSTFNLRKLYNFNKEKGKYELTNNTLAEAIIYQLPTSIG